MIVAVEIIEVEVPTVNQIRKLNGAPPLPDGDRPCEEML